MIRIYIGYIGERCCVFTQTSDERAIREANSLVPALESLFMEINVFSKPKFVPSNAEHARLMKTNWVEIKLN